MEPLSEQERIVRDLVQRIKQGWQPQDVAELREMYAPLLGSTFQRFVSRGVCRTQLLEIIDSYFLTLVHEYDSNFRSGVCVGGFQYISFSRFVKQRLFGRVECELTPHPFLSWWDVVKFPLPELNIVDALDEVEHKLTPKHTKMLQMLLERTKLSDIRHALGITKKEMWLMADELGVAVSGYHIHSGIVIGG